MDSLPTRPRSRARGGSARARTPLPILLVALVLVALARPGEGDAEPVRVFAVGHKQRLSDVESVASFRARMFALVDRAARGPGLVQDGVDDVASHVRPRDPAAPRLAVVHFPEDTGLTAGLIGSRGAAARAATSSTAAFASLLVPYADPIA